MARMPESTMMSPMSSSSSLFSSSGSLSSTCWSRRSRLERWLLGSAVTLFGVSAALATVLLLVLNGRSAQRDPIVSPVDRPHYADRLCADVTVSSPSVDLCLNPACIDASHRLLQNLNTSVDPCHDFYEYACGGFIDRVDIPDDKNSITSFVLLEEELKLRLKKLFDRSGGENEPETFRKTKSFYKTCTNETLVEAAGDEPLRRTLSQLGGWPVVEGSKWSEAEFDWQRTHHRLKDLGLGIDFLVDLNVGKDMKNSSRRVIELDQPSLGMPDRAYLLKGLNDSLVQAYFNLMVSVATALGADKNTVKSELESVLLFEIQLANFSLPKEERRNFTRLYHRMQVANLSLLAPQVKWDEYLTLLIGHTIIPEDELVVNVPSYMKSAFEAIEAVPKRVLANYLMWRVSASTLVLLDKRFRDMRMAYVKTLTGQAKETPRWLHCMSVASSAMPNAVGAMYVRSYFQSDAKTTALEMVNQIKARFALILGRIDWMDNVTRGVALHKLDTMKEHIAFPDELLDNNKLDTFYDKMVVEDGHHYDNVLHARRFAIDYAFNLLRKPVNKSDWVQQGDAAQVNAYYNPPENSIHFPAGILQGVFFDSQRPRYLNFGSIGFVIGHEITHGFDDQGRQFDAEGNLVDWWEAATDLRFREKSQCLIHQYGNFTVPENGLKVNGINTQGENIADNGGLLEAYEAYSSWLKQFPNPEPLLPGVDLTQHQLFWLSAANVWCSKERPETLALRVITGQHSPSRFRVNGPMMNSAYFARDFKCPVGSPMNPTDKCHMW